MQKYIETGKVIGANLIATGVTLSDVQTAMQFISWGVAIGYTLWKWRKESKQDKE